MKQFTIRQFLDESKNMKFHPLFEDNLQCKILFQVKEEGGLFSEIKDEIHWNSHSIEDDIFDFSENYHSIEEKSYANFLSEKTGLAPGLAVVLFSFWMILDDSKITKGYPFLFEMLDNIKAGFMEQNPIQLELESINTFYFNLLSGDYQIEFPSSLNWRLYFLNTDIETIEVSKINLITLRIFKKLILLSCKSVLYTEIKNANVKSVAIEYIYDFAKHKCAFKNDDILLFPPLVKTMHFSARASVIRKNLIILVHVSSWESYSVTVNGPYCVDNEISLSCINWGGTEALPGTSHSVMRIRRCEDIEGVVSKDHVHMHIEYPCKSSVSDIVKRLKGATSRKLQMEFPHLAQRYWGRHFWGIGYGAWSTGNITEEIVQQYLEHHRDDSSPNAENLILE